MIPEQYPQNIEDIHHGLSYYAAHQKYVKCLIATFFAPLNYLLKNASENGNLTFDSVGLSLGILDLKTRYIPDALRDIGYLINIDTARHGPNPIDKANDYHAALAVILAGLKSIQDRGGAAWNLSFKGKNYDVVLKMPINFISDDTEGLDKVVDRFFSRTKVKCLCRMCSCPFDSAGDHQYIFE
jgi:hypothetical protein